MRVVVAVALLLAAAGCSRGAPVEAPGEAARTADGVAAPTAGVGSVGEFKGVWRVSRVVVGPGEVQALVDDDPAYVGAKLVISDEAMSWDAGGREGTLDDRCERPVVEAPAMSTGFVNPEAAPGDPLGLEHGQPFMISCAPPSSFGPGAMMIKLPDGRLALLWYDNGLLILERV